MSAPGAGSGPEAGGIGLRRGRPEGWSCAVVLWGGRPEEGERRAQGPALGGGREAARGADSSGLRRPRVQGP